MKEKLRFGIIGSGFVALTHAEALRQATRAELTAIAGGSNAESLAKQYRVRCEASVAELIAASDVDAVVVCSPHAVHAQQSLACLDRGKHVLVEKPMACSEAECLSMIEAAARSARKLMVAHFQRYREPNAAAKQAIQSGKIGGIRIAQQRLLEAPNEKAWQLKEENRGFFLGYGIHGIDLLRWWFGSEIVEVRAVCHRFRNHPTEDGTQAIFTFSNGASASFLATDSLPARSAGKSPGAAGLTTLIIGEEAILDIDSYAETVLDSGEGREVLARLPSWDSLTSPQRIKAYLAQDEEFISCILEDTQSPISGEEGMRNVAAAIAAYESAQRGGPIAP